MSAFPFRWSAMNLMEEKKPKVKNEDEAFIDTLVEMLAEPHQDLSWNEKFKAIVRKHFDI
jgi:ATP-dependent Zn protease